MEYTKTFKLSKYKELSSSEYTANCNYLLNMAPRSLDVNINDMDLAYLLEFTKWFVAQSKNDWFELRTGPGNNLVVCIYASGAPHSHYVYYNEESVNEDREKSNVWHYTLKAAICALIKEVDKFRGSKLTIKNN